MDRRLAMAAGALALGAPAIGQDGAADRAVEAVRIEKSLDKRTGVVPLPEAAAELRLGDRYYFLGAADAKRVIVDLWGNPPGSADGVLGLVLPAGKTATDNVWGAVITYEASGYVSDEDADSADYDAMLAELREAEPEVNAERAKAGYPASHLVGWAQKPSYDGRTHSMVWARDFKVDGDQVDSLNYDVRLLGRRGVLSMNMISDMPHLAEVRAAAADFSRTARFVPGATYADFNETMDEKADHGVAGLVAAGVGAAAAKKLGLLGLILAFGKKLFVLIAAGAVMLGRRAMGLLRRRGEADAGSDAGPA